tara:strand:- start:22478 stop:27097 length:4620 start_codon:yes stop_codon:yes gene_type:complete
MKHLQNKRKFSAQGAGKKKPKPKPPVLKPPKLGIHQLASSFSYAEIIDLISDGPIKGLVNRNGSALNGVSNLQGIYLEGTPVAETNDGFVEGIAGGLENTFIETNTDISDILNDLGRDILQARSAHTTNTAPNTYGPFGTYIEWVSQTNAWRNSGGVIGGGGPGSFGMSIAGSQLIACRFWDYDGNSRKDLEYYEFLGPRNFSINYNNNTSQIPDRFLNVSSRDGTFAKHNTKNIFYVGYHNNDGAEHGVANVAVELIEAFGGFDDLQFTETDDNSLTKTQEYINNRFTNFGIESPPDRNIKEILRGHISQYLESYTWSQDRENFSALHKRDVALVIVKGQDIGEGFTVSNSDIFMTTSSDSATNVALDTDKIIGFKGNSSNMREVINFLYPVLDGDGEWDGEVGGFIAFAIDTATVWASKESPDQRGWKLYINSRQAKILKDLERFAVGNATDFQTPSLAQKYNYSNILSEMRLGEEGQPPFRYFSKVFIDHEKANALLGPFKIGAEIQTLKHDESVLTQDYTLSDPDGEKRSLPDNEGSVDQRTQSSNTVNFSNWDKGTLAFDEDSIPVTHIVENPNVEEVFVTLQVNNLFDTASTELGTDLDAGTKFPSVLNVEVEVGEINEIGQQAPTINKKFQIIALIESPTIIDIGNPDSNQFRQDSYKYIKQIGEGETSDNVFTAFALPKVYSARSNNSIEEVVKKRYVKVTKLSTETNSVLVSKDVDLLKITEVINVNCSYPFSAMAGIKLDSRTFSSVPIRTYEARLKQVEIPSNYFPLIEDHLQKDKRYYDNKADLLNAEPENREVYRGDWDGSFKFGWTDNPAWILYDLLTNDRYGLGQHIAKEDINKWDLYKIGRFCDAVNDLGQFDGVPDGRGGLEPRYSCNILFEQGTKAIDAINTIANLFRGSVFYNNKEINFLDDRIRDPIALFSNSNVRDSIFTYSNNRRDEQFNAIEVVYIDRFDDYKTKVEYIEDEEDIAQRGLFKRQVNALGVTSRAMANRVGRHLIFQTIKQNQNVSFTTGPEALLCKPGDLILIEDELKSLKSNFGRVLDVNTEHNLKRIRLSEPIELGTYESGITIYTPTGQQTQTDLEQEALGRVRLTGFHITGTGAHYKVTRTSSHDSDPSLSRNPDNPAEGSDPGFTTIPFSDFTGAYKFSGYSDGYADYVDRNDHLNGEAGTAKFEYHRKYPVYTGDPGHVSNRKTRIIYFHTGTTGWVFALEKAFQNNPTYDKFIGQTGTTLAALNTGFAFPYGAASGLGGQGNPRRGDPVSISGFFQNDEGQLSNLTHGVLESEIEVFTKPQITELAITGVNNTGFGSIALVDQTDVNANLVDFIPQGSAYRLKRKSSHDQTYKILSIREENTNEYGVIATKYITGKFDLIENSVSIDEPTNTFGYGATHQVGEVEYETLSNPEIIKVGIGTEPGIGGGAGELITGSWRAITNATGYAVSLRHPNSIQEEKLDNIGGTAGGTDNDMFSGTFSGITTIGNYVYYVKALGDTSDPFKKYFDSDFSLSGVYNAVVENYTTELTQAQTENIQVQ